MAMELGKAAMAGGLDHLVVVAHDLDRQADLYRRLGFQVGAQNRHDWGTLNHIVQFDGCFLELLSPEAGFQRPAPGAPLGQFVNTIADYLDAREGLAMMVLEGHDTAGDHAAFNAAGIGFPDTFYFARQGRRPERRSGRGCVFARLCPGFLNSGCRFLCLRAACA